MNRGGVGARSLNIELRPPSILQAIANSSGWLDLRPWRQGYADRERLRQGVSTKRYRFYRRR